MYECALYCYNHVGSLFHQQYFTGCWQNKIVLGFNNQFTKNKTFIKTCLNVIEVESDLFPSYPGGLHSSPPLTLTDFCANFLWLSTTKVFRSWASENEVKFLKSAHTVLSNKYYIFFLLQADIGFLLGNFELNSGWKSKIASFQLKL